MLFSHFTSFSFSLTKITLATWLARHVVMNEITNYERHLLYHHYCCYWSRLSRYNVTCKPTSSSCSTSWNVLDKNTHVNVGPFFVNRMKSLPILIDPLQHRQKKLLHSTVHAMLYYHVPQVAQLSQRYRTAGWVSYGQKWKTGTGRQYLQTIQVYIQPLRRIWPAKKSNWRKKHKIRAITPFKVIEVGTNQKPVCDFLLVINSNWHPLYRFGDIAAYCSNFGHFAFLSHHLGA